MKTGTNITQISKVKNECIEYLNLEDAKHAHNLFYDFSHWPSLKKLVIRGNVPVTNLLLPQTLLSLYIEYEFL